MKFKFSTLVAGALAGLLCIATGCARVDELDNRVTDLEKKFADLNPRLSSYEEQIKTLTEFKTTIEGMDLQGKFDAINKETAKIAGILSRLDNIDGAEGEIAKIKAELAALEGQGQTMFEQIDQQIKNLSNRIKNDSTALETYKKSTDQVLSAIINEIMYMGSDGKVHSYIDDIFGYLNELYGNDELLVGWILENADSIDVLAGEIATLGELYGELQGAYVDLNDRLSTIEADYLTKTVFDEYVRSAGEQAAAFAQKMKLDSTMFANRINNLEDDNVAIKKALDSLDQKIKDLQDADIALHEEISGTIERVETLEETVDGLKRTIGLLPADIKGFTEQVARHDEAINNLNGYVENLQGRMVKVEDLIYNRIQSLVYVPDYRDGMITISTGELVVGETTINLDNITSEINYQVKPDTLAPVIVSAWKAGKLLLAFDAARVNTRAEAEGVLALRVKDVELNADKIKAGKGIITVTVDPEDETMKFVNNSAVALILSDDKGNSRTTEYSNTTGKGGHLVTISFVRNPMTYGPGEYAERQYTDTEEAIFFSGREALFNIDGKNHPMTAAEVKAAGELAGQRFGGYDVSSHIGYINDKHIPEPEESFNITDNTDSVIVNLVEDKTVTVNSVNKTLVLAKKIFIKNATDTVRIFGRFKVLPLALTAELETETPVTWNFDEDIFGDNVKFNTTFPYAYNNHNIPVKVVKDNITGESALTLASFSHKTPVDYKVFKVAGEDTTEVKGPEFNNFKVAPAIKEGKLQLDSIAGFSFDYDKYFVLAKYEVKATEEAPACDTAYVKLNINIKDRENRDAIIAHTYPEVTLKIDKNFGGRLPYFVYKPNADESKNEFDYYNALPYKGTADLFAKHFKATALKTNVTKLGVTFQNTPDSIKIFVPYDKDNLEKQSVTSFVLKDTLMTEYGQKIALTFPVKVEWPNYDFKHDEYWVAQDANGFYSEVKPNYKGTDGKYNAAQLAEYDVFQVNMNQNFVVIDNDNEGKIVEDPAAAGLVIGAFLVDENHKYVNKVNGGRDAAMYNVTIDGGMISYEDSLAYVGAAKTLSIVIDGKKFLLPTSFGEGGKYYNFQVRKFEPFKYFGLIGDPVIKLDAIKTYTVNVHSFISMIDARDYECIDRVKYYANHWWVIGDGTNGFAKGNYRYFDGNAHICARHAYHISDEAFSFATSAIPQTLADKFTFNEKTGEITFNYTGEEFLQKDIVIPVEVEVEHVWGIEKATINITFQKEK